jgi:hypothetical protein
MNETLHRKQEEPDEQVPGGKFLRRRENEFPSSEFRPMLHPRDPLDKDVTNCSH